MINPSYLTDLASELDNLSGFLNKYVDENESCFRPSASVSNRDAPVDTPQNKVLHINDYRRKG
jgi:hypothetical protein